MIGGVVLGWASMSRQRSSRRPLRKIQKRVSASIRRTAVEGLRAFQNRREVYRPVFVAGSMGSGTSLLAVLLAQRFDFAGIAYESALQVGYRSPLRLRKLKRYTSIRAYENVLRAANNADVAVCRESLQQLYRRVAFQPGHRTVDKAPNATLLRVEVLMRCFPDAPFVLVIRDPVATIEGFRRKWKIFGRDTLAENIRFYADSHRAFLDNRPVLGDRVVIVEYEAIVATPDRMLDAVGECLGLRASTAQVRLEDRPNAPGKGLRGVEGGKISMVSDANRESHGRIGEKEIEEIQAALGSLHEEMRTLSLRPSV